jgi:hypothetical protein
MLGVYPARRSYRYSRESLKKRWLASLGEIQHSAKLGYFLSTDWRAVQDICGRRATTKTAVGVYAP